MRPGESGGVLGQVKERGSWRSLLRRCGDPGAVARDQAVDRVRGRQALGDLIEPRVCLGDQAGLVGRRPGDRAAARGRPGVRGRRLRASRRARTSGRRR